MIYQSAGKSWALLACLLWSYTAITRRAVVGRRVPSRRSCPVRSVLSRLTLAWACVHLINACITGALLFTTPLGIFLILWACGIYVVTGLAVVGSVLWGRHAGKACGITPLFEPGPRQPAVLGITRAESVRGAVPNFAD